MLSDFAAAAVAAAAAMSYATDIYKVLLQVK
jgi:hypothetical protein